MDYAINIFTFTTKTKKPIVNKIIDSRFIYIYSRNYVSKLIQLQLQKSLQPKLLCEVLLLQYKYQSLSLDL